MNMFKNRNDFKQNRNENDTIFLTSSFDDFLVRSCIAVDIVIAIQGVDLDLLAGGPM